MNFRGPCASFVVISWEKHSQFQENSFVMGHFYKLIIVQYNETLYNIVKVMKNDILV